MGRGTGRLILALALACAGLAGFGEPVRRMRVGLLTDTHVTSDPKRCELVRKAMALFAREQVDAICHLGDLADTYSPKGFELYRQAVEEAFGDKVPLTLYAFGGHDRNGYKLQPGETDREEAAWAVMKKCLKVSHGLYDLVEFRGYPFVIIQEYFKTDRAQQLVAKAAADHPGKPVFVLMHEPGIATTDDSCAWGNSRIRTICEAYPQVIHLSGHVHGSNRNEHNIWQGAYTEVNVGCLKHWVGHIGNCSAWANYKYDDGVMVMDVFDDAVTIRRYALRTGREYRPERPWSFPLPFDAATAPYAPATRRAKSRAPVWPDGAAISAVSDAHTGSVRVTVPAARHDEAVYRYTAELCDAAGRRITLKQALGEFWKTPESTCTGQVALDFGAAYFPTAGVYTVKVRPEDFYGNLGEVRTATVVRTAPETGWRTLWRAREPMRELTFGSRSSKKRQFAAADGWLYSERSTETVALPEASTVPAGAGRARIVYTLEDEHKADGTWDLALEDAQSGKGLCGPIQSVEGKAGPVTYVQDFQVPKDAPRRVNITMGYGAMASRLRFTDVRIDVKDAPAAPKAEAAAPAADVVAWRPGHYQVHFIYTGRGESMLHIFPDGTSLLLDVGDSTRFQGTPAETPLLPDVSRRAGEWVARYVARVNPKGSAVDYFHLSHYHEDHGGGGRFHGERVKAPTGDYWLCGLGDAMRFLTFGRVVDRAWPGFDDPLDVLTKSRDGTANNVRAVYAALAARGTRIERFRLGARDQFVQLNAAAARPDFKIFNLCANGRYVRRDGSVRDLYADRISRGATQLNENGLSCGLVVSYGKFRYLTAGDFSDGFKRPDGTVVQIEDELAEAVGPVDVAKLVHHGHHSMSAKLVRALRARVWTACVLDQQHCTDDTMRRLADTSLYPGERLILPTYMPQNRPASKHRQEYLPLVEPAVLKEPCHVVLDVEKGGERYSLTCVSAATETSRIVARHEFASSSK